MGKRGKKFGESKFNKKKLIFKLNNIFNHVVTKKEVSKKDHKYAFKKCTKEAKKNKLKTDCFIFAVNDKIVWKNFDKQAVLASKDAPLEKKISYLKCLNTNDKDYTMICDTWSNKVLQAFDTFPKFEWEK